MQTKFTMDSTIPSNDPLVMIKADRLEDEAKEIFEYVHRYKSSYNNVIPIKTDDKIVMLKTDQIILADINQTTLILYCMDAIYTTKRLRIFKIVSIAKILFKFLSMLLLISIICCHYRIVFQGI